MQLIIQRSTGTSGPVTAAEIKDMRELLDKLESEVQDTFETEQEEETESDERSDELIEQLVISEDEDGFLIEMFAPGFQKEDFRLDVNEQGILSVNAESENDPEEDETFLNARGNSRFYHAFQLPEDADTDEIEATYKENILTISIGKIINNQVLEDE